MTGKLVLLERLETGIVRLTFNRPEKLNALSPEVLEHLEAALNEIAGDQTIRTVLLTGAGNRAFVAGADINAYEEAPLDEFVAFQHRGRAVFDKIESLPQTTIAVVGGYALGGGFEIALCCDLIVCADTASFGLPEGLLGLSPGGGGTQRLTRIVGRMVAAHVMLAAQRLNGSEAHRVGLAARVVPKAELEAAALDYARSTLKVAPRAQREMKRLIRQGAEASLETAKTLEQEVLFRLFMSKDGHEGIAAFIARRPPSFTDR